MAYCRRCADPYLDCSEHKPDYREIQIDNVVRTLKAVWKKYPDLRLGQLLLNTTYLHGDLYYMGDETIQLLLKGINVNCSDPIKDSRPRKGIRKISKAQS